MVGLSCIQGVNAQRYLTSELDLHSTTNVKP
jgi:hypothetical protein